MFYFLYINFVVLYANCMQILLLNITNKTKMKQEYYISLYLDTRRELKNKKFPVKLRVFTPTPRRQKLYPTKFEMTRDEFKKIYKTEKPRNEHKEIRRKMQAVELAAVEIAEDIKPFNFDEFDRKLNRKPGEGVKVAYQYQQIIDELVRYRQYGTANSYELSRKSIEAYLKHKGKKTFANLTFYDITPTWLKEYESYMTDIKERSLTTVGIYLRSLRAAYNKAVREREIDREFYPFGKRKYVIPATKNVKKALDHNQLSTLFRAEPQTPEQEKARDFWFFSYACNGMNMKDILLLRYKDIHNDRIEFVRAKTKTTTKAHSRPVVVYLNDFAKEVINKYGNPDRRPENRVFDVLGEDIPPEKQRNAINNFTRFVNQHIKKLCKANGLPEETSTYWARHSFATNAIRNGASMEFIQESLGHENMKTTQNYFAGFDNDTKKEFAKKLMDFIQAK